MYWIIQLSNVCSFLIEIIAEIWIEIIPIVSVINVKLLALFYSRAIHSDFLSDFKKMEVRNSTVFFMCVKSWLFTEWTDFFKSKTVLFTWSYLKNEMWWELFKLSENAYFVYLCCITRCNWTRFLFLLYTHTLFPRQGFNIILNEN